MHFNPGIIISKLFFLSSSLPASSAACTHFLSTPHAHTHARALVHARTHIQNFASLNCFTHRSVLPSYFSIKPYHTVLSVSYLTIFINSKNLRTIRKLITYENFQDYSNNGILGHLNRKRVPKHAIGDLGFFLLILTAETKN